MPYDSSFLESMKDISNRLWFSNNHGHVASIIGAGFSKNADQSFPSWAELVFQALSELGYNEESIPSCRYIEILSEYELTFSRKKLIQLVNRVIDDNSVYPSEEYRKCLSLPWIDIFTTNYDRLLEKTKDIFKFEYGIISSYKDIRNSKRPRIVKLHGNLGEESSTNKLILTKNDYRTYPRKFAPLISLITTTLAENPLCLIGFSGDDQNFQEWLGWIDDYFPEKKLPIYVIGTSKVKISKSKSTFFRKNNIKYLDLSSLAIPNPYQDIESNSAKEKINLWLDLLLDSNPEKWKLWPKANKINFTEEYLSLYFSYKNSLNWSARINQLIFDETNKNFLIKYSEILKFLRLGYPGWYLLPHDNWLNYHQRFSDFFSKLDTIFKYSNEEKINILFELVWFSKIFHIIPDSRTLNLLNSIITEVNSIFFEHDDLSFIILEKMVEINCGLLRFFRLCNYKKEFFILNENLKRITFNQVSFRKKHQIEVIYYYYNQLLPEEVIDIINQWDFDNIISYEDLSVIPVMLEYCDKDLVISLIQKYLSIKATDFKFNDKILINTSKGMLITFLEVMKNEKFIIDYYSYDPDALKYRYNLWKEKNEYINTIYQKIKSVKKQDFCEVKDGFDLSTKRESYSFSSNPPDISNFYKIFISVLKTVGCSSLTDIYLDRGKTWELLKKSFLENHLQTLPEILRFSTNEEIENWLTKEELNFIPSEIKKSTVNLLKIIIIENLDFLTEKNSSISNYSKQILTKVVETGLLCLSRFSIIETDLTLIKIFLLFYSYKERGTITSNSINNLIDDLLKSFFHYLSLSSKKKLLIELCRTDSFSNIGEISDKTHKKDLFQIIDLNPINPPKTRKYDEDIHRNAEKLLEVIKFHEGPIKDFALARLYTLFHYQFLSENLIKKLFVVVSNSEERDNIEFPNFGRSYHKWKVLLFPSNLNSDSYKKRYLEDLLRGNFDIPYLSSNGFENSQAYYINSVFSSEIQIGTQNISSKQFNNYELLCPITSEISSVFIEKVLELYDSFKILLNPKSSIYDGFKSYIKIREHIELVIELLIIFLPYSSNPQKYNENIREMVSNLTDVNYPIYPLFPLICYLNPSKNEIESKFEEINKGIISFNNYFVDAACDGLYFLFIYIMNGLIDYDINKVFSPLINRIEQRCSPSLCTCLATCKKFLIYNTQILRDEILFNKIIGFLELLFDDINNNPEFIRLLISSSIFKNDFIRIQIEAVKIAFVVDQYCHKQKVALPIIITKWKDFSKKNAQCADIRNSWSLDLI